jgi:hypothetical protein
MGDATAYEADGTMTFTVTRSSSDRSSSVWYTTNQGSASKADYSNQWGQINFAAGESSKTISIKIANDGISESTEQFYVDLYQPSKGTSIAHQRGIGTINDGEAVALTPTPPPDSTPTPLPTQQTPDPTPAPAPTPTPTTHPVDFSTYHQFPSGYAHVDGPGAGTLMVDGTTQSNAIWDSTCDFAGWSGQLISPTKTIHIEYDWTVNEGSVTDADWQISGEIHNSDDELGRSTSPPFSIHFDNGHLQVVAIDGGATRAEDRWMWLYTDPNVIQEDRPYHISVDMNFSDSVSDTNGFLKVTVDGNTVVDYHGGLGYGSNIYWIPDLYREASSQTTSVSFDNMQLWTI